VLDYENLLYAVAKYTAQATRQEITLEELHKTLELIIKDFDKIGRWK
jgi:hypothetical protein